MTNYNNNIVVYFTISLLIIKKCENIISLKFNRKMIKMQNVYLRHANNNLAIKLAFYKIKTISCQHSQKSKHQPTDITNKALYLNYVQEVLKTKQNDLIAYQKVLNKKEQELCQIQFNKGITQLIAHIEEIKMSQRKVKHVQLKLGIRDQQYLSVYRKFQSQCTKYKNQMEQTLRKQYQDLMNQRKILRTKISQLTELEAYEKYLNQLNEALQIKSQQIAQRQSILEQSQIKNDYSVSYDTRKTKQLSASNRKRIKIFNTKPHSISQSQKNSSINQQYQNETFARKQAHDSNEFNQSSAIMGEDSKSARHDSNNVITVTQRQNISFRNQSNSKDNNISEQDEQHQQTDLKDCSIQVNIQTLNQTEQRLKKQALIIKYASKWIKNSLYSQKYPTTKKKAIAVDLWRLNSVFDSSIAHHAPQNIKALQSMWTKKQKILQDAKMFPYNQLSLKRRKYAELMFDLQQKIYHRRKIQTQLKTVLTNKHRKERLIFYLFFCKFYKNSFNVEKYNRTLKQKNKMGQTLGGATGLTGAQSNSQLISVTSSHIKNQQKINQPNKKSNNLEPKDKNQKGINSLKNQSRSISKQASSKYLQMTTNKQNMQSESKRSLKQNDKIKQILAQKQKTEKLLATQCVKLQGLIKMSVTLTESVFRTTNYVMKQMLETQYNTKINELTTQLNGLEFKFDLVMTKCRLGLANNSNKISTLQNLLDFTNLMK